MGRTVHYTHGKDGYTPGKDRYTHAHADVNKIVTNHAPAVLLWLFSVLYIAQCSFGCSPCCTSLRGSFGCSLCCTSLSAPLAVLCAVHRSVLLWLFSVLYIAQWLLWLFSVLYIAQWLLWLFSVLYIAQCSFGCSPCCTSLSGSFGCSLCCTSLSAPLAVLCAVHRPVLLWLFSILYISQCSYGCSLCCTSLNAPLAVLRAVHRSVLGMTAQLL